MGIQRGSEDVICLAESIVEFVLDSSINGQHTEPRGFWSAMDCRDCAWSLLGLLSAKEDGLFGDRLLLIDV